MEALLAYLREQEFLAPWIQALLSALTILIAYELGLRQSRHQFESALKIAKEEQRTKALIFLETILVIADRAGEMLSEAADPDTAALLARFSRFNLIEIDDLVETISAVPLHEIPVSRVAMHLLTLRNAMRQLVKVREAFKEIEDFHSAEGDVLDLAEVGSIFAIGIAAIVGIRTVVGEYRNAP